MPIAGEAFFLTFAFRKNQYLLIMEKVKKIPPQEASQTNPVVKPEDTKGGINNKVSSGLIGKSWLNRLKRMKRCPCIT